MIGAGTMGGGIAMCFANAGIPVTVIETEAGALERGLDRVKGLYAGSAKRGSITEAQRDERVGRITGAIGLEHAGEADIVIEAAFEDMGVKREIFSKLDAIAKPGAILATNTSYLDVNAIAAVTGRPQDVLGLHFFSPANVMRLVEVVRAEKTAPDVLATALDLGKRLNKLPVTVGVCFGFVGNRMLERRSRAGERLLLEGALPHEVDAAVTGFGFRMGPFAMGDLAGLDIGWRSRKDFGGRAPVADSLAEQGRFGQKTGRGFYLYPDGARTGTRDPEVEALIARVAAEHGITRRSFTPDEIVGAAHVPDGQRGRADPGGGHRGPARRHRYDLDQRLQLAGLARRPDALGRHGRAEDGRRGAVAVRGARPATTARRRRRSCAGSPTKAAVSPPEETPDGLSAPRPGFERSGTFRGAGQRPAGGQGRIRRGVAPTPHQRARRPLKTPEAPGMTDAVIVSTARTPIGKAHRGALNLTRGADLAAHAIRGALDRARLDPGAVEEVVLGCGYPENATGGNVARHAALVAGIPVELGRRHGLALLRLGPGGDRQRGAPDHPRRRAGGGGGRRRVDQPRAAEGPAGADPQRLARGAPAGDLHADDRDRRHRGASATASPGRRRTFSPWRASAARRRPRNAGCSTTRSSR